MFRKITSIVVLSCFVFIASCSRVERTEVMHEDATVVQMIYIPDTSDVDIAPVLTMDGNVTFAIVSSGHPALYGVTFRCEHHQKTFTLMGKSLYESLKPGDNVDLEYAGLVRIHSDGKREPLDHYKTIKVTTKK